MWIFNKWALVLLIALQLASVSEARAAHGLCSLLFEPPALIEIGQTKVAPYYEQTEVSSYLVADEVVELEHISIESSEKLRIQLYEYFLNWDLDLKVISEERGLNAKELAAQELIQKAQKKLRGKKWFHKRAVAFTSFIESSPEYELGAFAQLIIVDLLFPSGAKLDSDKLAEGEVEFLKTPRTWPKKAREFINDRFLKKYTGQILWWGPMLIVYIKWGDPIMAYLEKLLN